jgi:dienelactone hydrolase
MSVRILLTTALLLLLAGCADQAPSASAAGENPIAANDTRLPAAPLNEEVHHLTGDPDRPVTLEVTLFKPDGPGPFPLAVMNHGATNASDTNRGERYRFTVSAYYFLSRGYAVALPMMRGFAGSGGRLFRDRCNLAEVAETNSRDISAVIADLARRPDIDGTRIVVAGQSFGGWNTLGVGTAPPPGVRGLVAFNPALRSSDCQTQDSSMAAAAAQLGARTRLASLWFFGDNDTVMPVPTWRAMFEAYTRAGGRAELVDVGPYKNDSHQFLSFPESLPLWAPKVDAFLQRIGLPASVVFPDYLPHPAPPATNWAALSDAAAVPYLGDRGRAIYQRFLNAPLPRAFVISPNGLGSDASGGYDPLGRALRACGQHSEGCRAYAVNDAVVWRGADNTEPLAPRLVTRAVMRDSSTSLGTFLSIKPDCSLRGLPQVAIAEKPSHGTAYVAAREQYPAFPANSPYAACNATRVRAVGVTYTPAPGYAGDDVLTIEETDADGRRHLFRITLNVS